MITTTHTIDGTEVKPGVFIGSTEQVLGRTLHVGGRCERVNDQWTPVLRFGHQILWEGDVRSSQADAEGVARRHVETVLDRAVTDLFK